MHRTRLEFEFQTSLDAPLTRRDFSSRSESAVGQKRRVVASSTTTTAAAGNATATTAYPAVKTYKMDFKAGSSWGGRPTPKPFEIIVFTNAGIDPVKNLYRVETRDKLRNCNLKGATLLHQFTAFGQKFRYTVPYTFGEGLYLAANSWLCTGYGLKFAIPVADHA
ncbi:unnamed protein product [Closterium sp. Yama58-4]|nr:unnamed protein product [Closterium sp. Yama58-4]